MILQSSIEYKYLSWWNTGSKKRKPNKKRGGKKARSILEYKTKWHDNESVKFDGFFHSDFTIPELL